ncbi:MAG: RNA polymerase sigma factor [Candidatus Omnitrophica bacterium]|nr:RNA polymerase sigma factor [Candidatus Omnitrophota bacterium]
MSDDKELIQGISRRDPEAFRLLLERYARPLVSIAHRLVGTRHEAEDLVQEVFLRLYERSPALNEKSRLFTWLYRVTINKGVDLLRAKSRGVRTISLESAGGPQEEEPASWLDKLPDLSVPSPREQSAVSEHLLIVQKAVSSLPISLRLPLLLFAVEELSQQQIAEILQMSPKAVERRIARARSLLKEQLRDII